MTTLALRIDSLEGVSEAEIDVTDLVIAGWTGRNRDAMEHHIAELEALGVKRPAQTPMYYPLAARRLTQEDRIDVLGDTSSGEAEFVLIGGAGRLYVGVGSDHTDREAETVGVTLSKQMCDKPIGAAAWPFDEVEGHWDQLILRSYATIDGKEALYQEGAVAMMMTPAALIELYEEPGIAEGTVMFGGTLPAIGGVRPATAFRCELEDPVLDRRLTCRYAIRSLPVRG